MNTHLLINRPPELATSSYRLPTKPLTSCCTWQFSFTQGIPALHITHDLAPTFTTWISPKVKTTHISTMQTKNQNPPFSCAMFCLSCILNCSSLKPRGPGLSSISVWHYGRRSKPSRVSATRDTNDYVKNHTRPQTIPQFFNRGADLENSEPRQVVFQSSGAFSAWAFISTTRLGSTGRASGPQEDQDRVCRTQKVYDRWNSGGGLGEEGELHVRRERASNVGSVAMNWPDLAELNVHLPALPSPHNPSVPGWLGTSGKMQKEEV